MKNEAVAFTSQLEKNNRVTEAQDLSFAFLHINVG